VAGSCGPRFDPSIFRNVADGRGGGWGTDVPRFHHGHDESLLRAQVRRVVLHEIAHHFGISDERLVELGGY